MKEALDDIVSFDTTAADADEHFFRVEMIGIVETNSDLLDVEKVRNYLSFVAPVTYICGIHLWKENNSEENHERKFFSAEKCRPLVA